MDIHITLLRWQRILAAPFPALLNASHFYSSNSDCQLNLFVDIVASTFVESSVLNQQIVRIYHDNSRTHCQYW